MEFDRSGEIACLFTAPILQPVPLPRPQGPIDIAIKGASVDLAKSHCYALFGFKSAGDAMNWLNGKYFDGSHMTIKFNVGSYGKPVLTNGVPTGNKGTDAAAWTFAFGAVNINSDWNWGDFSKVPGANGGTYDYLKSYSSAFGPLTNLEMGSLIILHELAHNDTTLQNENPDDPKQLQKIYDNCIK